MNAGDDLVLIILHNFQLLSSIAKEPALRSLRATIKPLGGKNRQQHLESRKKGERSGTRSAFRLFQHAGGAAIKIERKRKLVKSVTRSEVVRVTGMKGRARSFSPRAFLRLRSPIG